MADKYSPDGWRETAGRFVERRAGAFFLAPAAITVLIFSIFPLLASLYVSFSSLRFSRDGAIFRFVGFKNYKKLLLGSEQYHFLGRFGDIGAVKTILAIVITALLAWWLVSFCKRRPGNWLGLAGRAMTAAMMWMLLILALALLGGSTGTLATTLIYVFTGCSVQFLIGLGLALLCARQIRGRHFFRVIFFLPLMVTPVGVAYSFRMLADMSKGPFSPVWHWLGLREFAWAVDPVAARAVVVLGDSWQWIPFVFIVMLAAVEGVSGDQREAAEMDGAGSWQVFRHVTWPAIMPVAATVVLIRVIEAFKIIDLPNVLTNGGPGISTESMALHSYTAWRALDVGSSAAVAYMLLVVSAVLCVSYYNLIVSPRKMAAS